MSLSAKYIQHLKTKETKSTRRKSECNVNATNDWDSDLISRWTRNSCLECNNQECRLQNILTVKNLQVENKSAYEVKEFLIHSLTDVLCNKSLINDAVKNETSAFFENIFHGCNSIMSNNEMQCYFKSNVKHLTFFVKSSLEFVFHIFEFSNDETIKSQAEIFLSRLIVSYLQIYRQFSDKESFATEFLNIVLFPFCNLMKFENLKFQSDLNSCIKILLFTKNFLPQYKRFNNEQEGIPATLFSTLEKIANIDLKTAFIIFDVIFSVAVKSYESDAKVLDLIFRNIVKSAKREKIIVKKLLDRLLGIHLVLENQIDDVKLSDYLMMFVDEILKKEIESLDYDLMTVIINVHPFTVETNFENILIKFIPKYPNVSERSYCEFFLTILNVSISLRREHKLISLLLTAAKSVITENLDAEHLIPLPKEFLTKFMESLENTTISQTTTILRSLIYYLKPYSENSVSNSMLEVIFQLLISFMKGIKIFECIRNVKTQEKFCDDLVELGNLFSALADKISNKRVIFTFLKACQAWNDVCNLILHYVPSTISEKLRNLLSAKKWIKLFEKVESLFDENPENSNLDFSCNLLINFDIEKSNFNFQSSFWISVFENNSNLLFNLTEEQLTEFSATIVSDALNNSNCKKWDKCLNDRFLSTFLNQLIIKGENCIRSENTKQFVSKITRDFKWKKIVSKLKNGSLMKSEEFSKNTKSKDCKLMREFLRILSSLHLCHLHHDIRIVLFILISSIVVEFSHDIEIAEKCNEILLDLLQENDINIFQFPNLKICENSPLGNDVLSQLFELPLKNDSFNSLINFLSSNDINDNLKITLLNIILRTKLHRKSEDTQLLRNLIEKWNKFTNDDRIQSRIELVLLIFSLKDAIISRNPGDDLKANVNRILKEIFLDNANIDDEYVQLLEIVLRNRSFLEITDENVALIFKAILSKSNESVLRPFLETLNSKEFDLLLKDLQKQTLLAFSDESENELKKCLKIWEYVIIIEMATARNNIRVTAINKLLLSLNDISIGGKHWLCLIKLFETIVSSKFIQITGQIIDLILVSCTRCMKRVGVVACREIVSLYTMIVRLRTNFVKDKLWSLVQLNSEIIRNLNGETMKLNSFGDQYQIECLILDMEKFIIALKKFDDNVLEIYPYLLNDLVEWYCHQLLPKNLKNHLELIIQRLLSHCEHEKIEFLNRTMPVATQKIFKELVTMYRKHYKFTGKI
ncbi:uncharacterized protein LOC122508927 [Leptopilina heterotoma]|uniref:uncharacterized protein LOC122508927 n=1 Tax=Leptopilina heterotoma TaxID=63436 RepID=UPI001CA89393|nr:uncharacterized protein LOC122508927 [Leptopilina heterotoma]XP_043478530.1 uncharacterized protein LOC122508927 [Leptopilina heterotoma]